MCTGFINIKKERGDQVASLYVTLTTGWGPCADFSFNWVFEYQLIASKNQPSQVALKEHKAISQETKKVPGSCLGCTSILYIYFNILNTLPVLDLLHAIKAMMVKGRDANQACSRYRSNQFSVSIKNCPVSLKH